MSATTLRRAHIMDAFARRRRVQPFWTGGVGGLDVGRLPRARKRERETDRQTDRQTDRRTQRQTERTL